MAYPAVHLLTVMGGPLFGVEQWSTSFRSTMVPQTPAGVESVFDAIQTWYETGDPVMGNAAGLGFIKHNTIGLTGRYLEDVTQERVFEPTLERLSNPNATNPPQVALVATLETGATRGLAHRGRMFMPAPIGTASRLTGLISEGDATDLAVSLSGLFTTLNGLEGFGTVSVMSDVRDGASRPVTAVSVGRVLDTMRSRRAQISEERPLASPVGGT